MMEYYYYMKYDLNVIYLKLKCHYYILPLRLNSPAFLTDPLYGLTYDSSITFRTLNNHQKWQNYAKNEEKPCLEINNESSVKP